MDDRAINTIGELLGVVVTVTSVLWAAAMWHASKHFATRKDLDGVGSRVNGLETVATQARDSADEAQQGIRELRQEHRHLAERTTEKMEETAHKLDACVSRLEKTIQTMVRLEERIANRQGGQ